jgi:dienelactone hydrolase
MEEREVVIPVGEIELLGDIAVPDGAVALVIFSHGSGSNRQSPRNKMVASVLDKAGFATLLFDSLTEEEDFIDQATREYRFDIPLISDRLIAVTKWLMDSKEWGDLKIGYFGASTGAAAALNAASAFDDNIFAVVSRGGRPDLANDEDLHKVVSPSLFIVGGEDEAVMRMNEEAIMKIPKTTETELKIVPGAYHLFEEPGKLEEVAALAVDWFSNHLPKT